MKSRRAGHGCSSGAQAPAPSNSTRERDLRRDLAVGDGSAEAKLGDDPRIAAALRYAGEDVRAYEQTEAAWRAVWAEDLDP